MMTNIISLFEYSICINLILTCPFRPNSSLITQHILNHFYNELSYPLRSLHLSLSCIDLSLPYPLNPILYYVNSSLITQHILKLFFNPLLTKTISSEFIFLSPTKNVILYKRMFLLNKEYR